ncbi:MAG: hypothetical protein H6867_03670 [Rhodospirillales bacterium]|nr:hypothetical protein [Rhodospirillales bacterium]MCB9996250.1 hypothetical protein [Rhodospirillales bacterium]
MKKGINRNKLLFKYDHHEVLIDFICELIENQDQLHTNYPKQRAPYERSFLFRKTINNDHERADAVLELIFGKNISKDKAGPKSFKSHDRLVARQMKMYIDATGTTKNKALRKFAPDLKSKSHKTKIDTLRNRLNDAYEEIIEEMAMEESKNYGLTYEEAVQRAISKSEMEDMFLEGELDIVDDCSPSAQFGQEVADC